jgi:hypothetical protein
MTVQLSEFSDLGRLFWWSLHKKSNNLPDLPKVPKQAMANSYAVHFGLRNRGRGNPVDINPFKKLHVSVDAMKVSQDTSF